MRTSNILILVAAVVMGAVAAFMARAVIQGQANQGPPKTIVVATAALEIGLVIPENKIAEITWGSATLPDGAFATKAEFLKDGQRFALAPIARNEPLLRSKVATAGKGGFLSTLLDKDMRAVTVRVDDTSGVAGFIQPNSRVDIALIRSEGGRGESYSNIILQNVKVLAIDQLTAQPDKPAQLARAITIEVTSEDAQRVLLAEKVGRLSLILRQPGEANEAGARRITERDLSALPIGPTKAEAAEARPPVQRSDNTTVIIVRGSKPEEYLVKSATER